MKKPKMASVLVQEKLVLKLYVSGMTPKSMEAIENIKKLCRDYLDEAFDLEIIDIYKNPEIALEQHIVFSPSLVKKYPLPRRTLVGTLSDKQKLIKALGISFREETHD